MTYPSESSESVRALRARPRAIKPLRSSVPQGFDRSLIVVKFQDGIDLDADLSESPGNTSGGLRSEQARNALRETRELGGVWRRTSSMDRAVLERLRARAQLTLGREIADLSSYYTLRLPPRADPLRVMDALNGLAEVELAAPAPLLVRDPQARHLATRDVAVPDFEPLQGYLSESPGGLDARFVWTIPGGTGEGVSICDMEGGWNLEHEDLPPATVLFPDGETPFQYVDDHGTEVLGTMFSLPNGWGTTGASYGARCYVAPTSLESGYGLFQQILWASSQLDPGDVILIEVGTWGPYHRGDGTPFGMVPIEWEPAMYNAILTAVGNGIHVVEPAGNGNQNLDDPVYVAGIYGHAPFTPENNSGAIMVGAGVPPTAPELGSDCSRSSFSNYGSRLDVQAWGHRVTTTGAGDLYSDEGPNRMFTRFFGGTSSAGPLVASAIASIEGIVEHATGTTVSPTIMRSLLIDTGTPQQSGIRPAEERIGPRPDLRAALQRLGAPIVSAPSTIRCFAGDTLGLIVEAADLSGGAIDMLVTSGLPVGAVFTPSADQTRGELLWSPQTGQEGLYTVVFAASNGETSTDTTHIFVEDAERGPVITGPGGDVAVEEGPPLRVTMRATDPNGDPILRFEAIQLPSGAAFTPDPTNSAGELYWRPNYDQAGMYVVRFRAVSVSAGLGGQEQTGEALLVIRVQNHDRAPEVEAPNPVEVAEGESLTLTVTAHDADGDLLTDLSAEDLPPGAVFTAEPSHARGTLTWTPSFEQAGFYFIQFYATSSFLRGTAHTFLDVLNTDRPPKVQVPATVQGIESVEIAFDMTASDPDGDPMGVIGGVGLPMGSQFFAKSNGSARFSWTPRFGDAGEYSMTFGVSSNPPFEAALSDSATVTITVDGGMFAAAVSLSAGEGPIRLLTGGSGTALLLEAVGGAFNVAAVDPGKVYWGELAGMRIQPDAGAPVVGDRDQDGLADIELRFSKENLRQLFTDVTTKQTTLVALSGELPGGGGFSGSIQVEVDPQRAITHASVNPNPSRSSPSLSFYTSAEGPVRITLYDVRGAVVGVDLDERRFSPGFHDIVLGRGRAGRLPSGVYYYRLETPDGNISGKFILLK